MLERKGTVPALRQDGARQGCLPFPGHTPAAHPLTLGTGALKPHGKF